MTGVDVQRDQALAIQMCAQDPGEDSKLATAVTEATAS